MAPRWPLLLLLALCVLLAIADAYRHPFLIQGRVYCDTCRCGFETNKTTYIPGAKIRIECKDRATLQLKYTIDALTDSTGTYEILVEDDHQDQICYATLVSSPIADCKAADPGRSRSEVILTRSNGVISNLHFANNMGFLRDQPLSGCSELVKSLLESDI